MNKPDKVSEEELAAAVKLYYEGKAWDSYPEVVLPNFNGRPDLAIVKQNLVGIVEVKNTLSYPVIEQLTRWHHEYEQWSNSEYSCNSEKNVKGIPHLLIAAVSGLLNISILKQKILDEHRIGVVSFNCYKGKAKYRHQNKKNKGFDQFGYACIGDDEWHVREFIQPKIQVGSRKTARHIIKHLNTDMRLGIAGSSGNKGAYMTPFKRTMHKVELILSNGEEWHIRNIIEKLNKEYGGHHYASDSSAVNCIAHFIVKFDMAENSGMRFKANINNRAK